MSAGVHPSPPLPAPALRREPGPPAPPAPDPGPVVVPASARFEGLLTFRGRACVEGVLEGEVVCRGTLSVGIRGRVVGTVEADEVIVAGTVVGELTARDRVELRGTARVEGTIRAPRILMEDGSVLDGRCETGAAPEAPPSTEA